MSFLWRLLKRITFSDVSHFRGCYQQESACWWLISIRWHAQNHLPSQVKSRQLCFFMMNIRYIFQAPADISTKQKAWTTHLLYCTNELLVVRLSWNPETISNCHLVHRGYNKSENHYYFQVADYCNCFENGVGGKFRSFTMCGPPQISESLSSSLQHFFYHFHLWLHFSRHLCSYQNVQSAPHHQPTHIFFF